jgi:voltage-gated potassium channel Kch
MLDASHTRASLTRTWRWLRWRWIAVVLVFICGLAAFELGVGVSDRAGVAEAHVLTKAYYTIGLFMLGGMDLGVPVGGTALGRALLWMAYFVAPAITASAVVEGVLRAIQPRGWGVRRLRGHILVAGCGRLTMLYLRRLRQRRFDIPVVVVEKRPDRANLDEARAVYGAAIVVGDITSDALLATLRLEHAARVLLLTGDDFANLDAASKIMARVPRLAARMVVHISDSHFLAVMDRTRIGSECTVFNTHQIAARHLVQTKLIEHFLRTDPLDTVVLAGFGRFGQTVLAELQRSAAGKFTAVVIVDIDCRKQVAMFEEQVGFVDGYERLVVEGDLRDPEVWRSLRDRLKAAGRELAFVVSSGDDGVNLQTAMWLSKHYDGALIVARSFYRSAFADEVSKRERFEVISVADLVGEGIPAQWLRRR